MDVFFGSKERRIIQRAIIQEALSDPPSAG